MSYIVSFSSSIVSKLNQPEVKQGIKNIAGIITFAGGILSVATVLSSNFDRKAENKSGKHLVFNLFRVEETTILKASLFFSAVASPIGNALAGKIANAVFGAEKLIHYFGPNTIFAVNPKHPRHVMSFVAAVSILPSLFFVVKKSLFGPKLPLLYPIFRKIAFFNLITSRPVLHIGNTLAGRIFKAN